MKQLFSYEVVILDKENVYVTLFLLVFTIKSFYIFLYFSYMLDIYIYFLIVIDGYHLYQVILEGVKHEHFLVNLEKFTSL